MRALTTTADGGLELTPTAELAPAADEVLIDVAAAGVNRADLLQRAGKYPPPPGASDVLGLEVSGTVAALGESVTTWEVGERVCALLAGGGYAEQVVAPASQLLPVPDSLDLVDAAALPEAVCTAWSNLVITAGLTDGDTVLVHGGSGGVGSVAIQLARAVGARVLATAGGPARAARCQQLGADLGIDYHQDVPAAVAAATEERGVDVVLDVLGAGGLQDNLRMLATGGRLVVIGTQRGTRGEIDLMQLLGKRASLHGTTLRSRPEAEKAAIVAAVRGRVWPMLEDGRLRAVVHDRLPLAEAARAHAMLEAGEVFGKLLLIPG